MRRLLLLTVLAGCASGPRPVPSSATSAERLVHAEREADRFQEMLRAETRKSAIADKHYSHVRYV